MRPVWARRLASRTSRISTSRPNGQRKLRGQRRCRTSRVLFRRPAWMLDPGHRASGRPPKSPTRVDGRGWLVPPPDGEQNLNRCYGGVGRCGNFLHRKIFAGRSCADRKIAVAATGSRGGDGPNTHGHRSADPTGGIRSQTGVRVVGRRPRHLAQARTVVRGPSVSATDSHYSARRRRDRSLLSGLSVSRSCETVSHNGRNVPWQRTLWWQAATPGRGARRCWPSGDLTAGHHRGCAEPH